MFKSINVYQNLIKLSCYLILFCSLVYKDYVVSGYNYITQTCDYLISKPIIILPYTAEFLLQLFLVVVLSMFKSFLS